VHDRVEVIGGNIATAAITNSHIRDCGTPVSFLHDSILVVESRDPMRSSSLQKCMSDRMRFGCGLYEDIAARSSAGRICGPLPIFNAFVDL
jgi:hypothetical protein